MRGARTLSEMSTLPDGCDEFLGRSFETFAEASHDVLETLERLLPQSAVLLTFFDASEDTYRIVDVRGDHSLGREPGVAVPLDRSFCAKMAKGLGPALANDVPSHPVYGPLNALRGNTLGSYCGVPLELGDGTAIGSLCAISREKERWQPADYALLQCMARALASQLERQRNESDLNQLAAELRTQAMTDPLSGLLNRRSFLDVLAREYGLSRRGTVDSYVVIADIDGLKEVNDRAGHGAGDRVIQGVAGALTSAARDTDVIGRLGGDEFGVVLIGCAGPAEAATFVGRVRRALLHGDATGDPPAEVSVGTHRLGDSTSAEDALDLADRMMYAQKRGEPAGRGVSLPDG